MGSVSNVGAVVVDPVRVLTRLGVSPSNRTVGAAVFKVRKRSCVASKEKAAFVACLKSRAKRRVGQDVMSRLYAMVSAPVFRQPYYIVSV